MTIQKLGTEFHYLEEKMVHIFLKGTRVASLQSYLASDDV